MIEITRMRRRFNLEISPCPVASSLQKDLGDDNVYPSSLLFCFCFPLQFIDLQIKNISRTSFPCKHCTHPKGRKPTQHAPSKKPHAPADEQRHRTPPRRFPASTPVSGSRSPSVAAPKASFAEIISLQNTRCSPVVCSVLRVTPALTSSQSQVRPCLFTPLAVA